MNIEHRSYERLFADLQSASRGSHHEKLQRNNEGGASAAPPLIVYDLPGGLVIVESNAGGLGKLKPSDADSP